MSTYTTVGLVLRRFPLGEADSIVHLLSKERGKLDVVAKGARRPRSKHLAVTQPFVYGRYLLFPGRTLERLNQGEVLSAYRRLREELDYFALCTYCCELVDKLLPVGEPAENVFVLVKGLFDYLQETPASRVSLGNALTFFRLKLLAALGYQVDFASCTNCGRGQELSTFSFKEGGPLCAACSGRDQGALAVAPAVFASLVKLSSLGWPKLGIIKLEPYQQTIEDLLEGFYRYHLEVEAKSSEFLKSIRR
ncbi:MAG: DNA repair protein RecO [Firmicutes bacterium]|nr:DNA repair protein RecO [Bacillota bacterium]